MASGEKTFSSGDTLEDRPVVGLAVHQDLAAVGEREIEDPTRIVHHHAAVGATRALDPESEVAGVGGVLRGVDVQRWLAAPEAGRT